jgi:hypothetical protein
MEARERLAQGQPIKEGIAHGLHLDSRSRHDVVDIYFWCKARNKKPLPRIVGSVPYVPLKK